jgi:hypothetical protein
MSGGVCDVSPDACCSPEATHHPDIGEPSASARGEFWRATARCLAEACGAKADHRAAPVAEIVQCGEPDETKIPIASTS